MRRTNLKMKLPVKMLHSTVGVGHTKQSQRETKLCAASSHSGVCLRRNHVLKDTQGQEHGSAELGQNPPGPPRL